MGVGADVNSVVGCRYGCYGVGQVVLVLEDVGVNVSVNILGVNVGVMGVGALGQAVWRRLNIGGWCCVNVGVVGCESGCLWVWVLWGGRGGGGRRCGGGWCWRMWVLM